LTVQRATTILLRQETLMPRDLTTPVLRNVELGHGNFLIEFASPGLADGMQPAQFFMIGVPGGETLLRRPYSVCGLPGTFDDGSPGAVQVLYKVVGRGTGLLSALKPGAALEVLGPLGRGFRPPARPGARPVLVAGGIGCAPFPALARSLGGRAPILYYGARSERDLPLLDWFERHTERVVVTTEDGSRGRRGLVTESLAEMLAAEDPSALELYACGPQRMLEAVARLALARGVACQLSLEAHMACGFGVCLGCVVPTRRPGSDETGYDRVCVEGPVMEAGMLAW
jgi:dihydroorotate dehydrogenase electron transfer subunit